MIEKARGDWLRKCLYPYRKVAPADVIGRTFVSNWIAKRIWLVGRVDEQAAVGRRRISLGEEKKKRFCHGFSS